MYLQEYFTERLCIRPLTEHDKLPWMIFFNDAESVKYLPEQPDFTIKQKVDFWFDKQYARYKENRYGLMALTNKTNGELIGQCGLLSQEFEGEPVLEIGYHLMPNHRGLGYATEAATFMKHLAFTQKYAKEVVSIIDKGNMASVKVAERNGMAIKRDGLYWGLQVYLFSITDPKVV